MRTPWQIWRFTVRPLSHRIESRNQRKARRSHGTLVERISLAGDPAEFPGDRHKGFQRGSFSCVSEGFFLQRRDAQRGGPDRELPHSAARSYAQRVPGRLRPEAPCGSLPCAGHQGHRPDGFLQDPAFGLRTTSRLGLSQAGRRAADLQRHRADLPLRRLSGRVHG